MTVFCAFRKKPCAWLIGATLIWMGWGGASVQANVAFVGNKEIRSAEFPGAGDGYNQSTSYRNDLAARLYVYFRNTNTTTAITITNFTINGTNIWALPTRTTSAGDAKWRHFWPNPVPAGKYGAVWCYLPLEKEALGNGEITFGLQTDRGTSEYVFDPEPSPLWIPSIYFTNGLDKAIFYIGNQGDRLLQLSDDGGISINGTAVTGQPLETNLPPGQVIPVAVSGIRNLVGLSSQAIFQVTAADGMTQAIGHMRVSASTFGVTWWYYSGTADPVDSSNHFCNTDIPGTSSFMDEPSGNGMAPSTLVAKVAAAWAKQTAANMSPLMISLTGVPENERYTDISDIVMVHHGPVEMDLDSFLSWPKSVWYLPQDGWGMKESLDIPEGWRSMEDLKYQTFDNLGRGAKNIQWFLYQNMFEQGYSRGGGTELTRRHQDMTMIAAVANPLLYDRIGRISGVVQMFKPYLIAGFPLPDLLADGIKIHTVLSGTSRAVVFVTDERTPKNSWARPWDYGTPRFAQQVLYGVPAQCSLPTGIYDQVSAAFMVDPFLGVTNVSMSKLGNGRVQMTVPVLEAGAAILLGTAADGTRLQAEWAQKSAAFSNYCDHARADSLARGWSSPEDWKYPGLNYRAVISVTNTGGSAATAIGLPINLASERQYGSNAIRVVELAGAATNEVGFYFEPQKVYEDWSVNPTSAPARVSPAADTGMVRPVYDAGQQTLRYYFKPAATTYSFAPTINTPSPWGANRWVACDFSSLIIEGDFNSNPYALGTTAGISFDTNMDGVADIGSGVNLAVMYVGTVAEGTILSLSNNWRRYIIDLRKVFQYCAGTNRVFAGQWRLNNISVSVSGSERTGECSLVLGKISVGAGTRLIAQPSGGGLPAGAKRIYHVYYDFAENAGALGVSGQFNSGLAGAAVATGAVAATLGVEAAGARVAAAVGSQTVTLTARSGASRLILRHLDAAGAIISEQTLAVAGGQFTATLTRPLAADDLLVCIPIQAGGEGLMFCYDASGRLVSNAPAGALIVPERWQAGLDGIAYDLDLSPDGQRLLVASGAKIRLLDRNGNSLWVKSYLGRSAYGRFSTDGQSVYAAANESSVRFGDGWRIFKYDLAGNLLFTHTAGMSETYPGRTVFNMQAVQDGSADGGVMYTEWNGKAYRLGPDGSVLWATSSGGLYTEGLDGATNGVAAILGQWANFVKTNGGLAIASGSYTPNRISGEAAACALRPDGKQMVYAGSYLKVLTSGGVNAATNYIGRNPRVIRYSENGTRVAAGTCEGNFAFMTATNLNVLWKKKVDGSFVTDIRFLPGTNGVVVAYECFTYQLNNTPNWRFRDQVVAYDWAGNEKWRSEGSWRSQPFMDKLAVSSNGQCLAVLTHDAVRLMVTTEGTVSNDYLYSAAVDRPALSPMQAAYANPTQFALAVTTANARIWYTLDGTTPDAAAPSLSYDKPFVLGSNALLRARAFAPGLEPSPVLAADLVFRVADPTIAPNGGDHPVSVAVTLASATQGAVIRYTTDGRDPDDASTVYAGPFRLETDTVVRAWATHAGGMTPSGIATSRLFRFSLPAPTNRVESGLAALYTFREGAGATVRDVSGVAPALDLTISDISRVQWLDHSLDVIGNVVIASAGAAEKIWRACTNTGEGTIEAWIRTADTNQFSTAMRYQPKIVSFGSNYMPTVINANMALSQTRSQYQFGCNPPGMNGSTEIWLWSTNGSVAPELTHVVLTRSNQAVRMYLNGALATNRIAAPAGLEWANYPLTLASATHLSGQESYWHGSFYLVAVYARALTFSQVLQNYGAGANPTYQIQTTWEGAGAITPSNTFVGYKLDAVFDLVPALGWSVSNVVLNGQSLGGTNQVTVLHVDSNQTLHAIFYQVRDPAVVTLSGLDTTYNGAPHPVSVTTVPTGLLVAVTYNGQPGAPTHAGAYAVTGLVVDAQYAGMGTGRMTVARAVPGIAWTNPLPVASGTALGPAQLKATSPVSGGFIYTPPAGTVLSPGAAQVLQADFTPLDGTNYNPAAAQVLLSVDPVIAANAGVHGTLEPVGTVRVSYGSDTQFLARAVTYYHIGSLQTNGAPLTAAAGQAAYTVRWARVTADGQIRVDFAEDRASGNGTPYWWLAQYGLTNGGWSWDAAEMNDADQDTFANWQEYVAATDPTNAASYFHQEIARGAGGVFMQWPGAPERLYRIWAASNLLLPGWTLLGMETGRTSGVITYTNPLPSVWHYYRLSVVSTNP